MNHDKDTVSDANIHDNEKELLSKINDLKHICFGMYQKIIPTGNGLHTKEAAEHTVQIIASELASESLGGINEGESFLFYLAFYQTTIFFLLGSCNEEDQILLSLRKIANTFNRCAAFPLESTTFYYLLEAFKEGNHTGDDRMYAELCFQHYAEYKEYYANEMDRDMFIRRINSGVNRYADKHGYSCIESEDKFRSIMTILNDACNEAYFTLYQMWEN